MNSQAPIAWDDRSDRDAPERNRSGQEPRRHRRHTDVS
jgi:hypothetical protein